MVDMASFDRQWNMEIESIDRIILSGTKLIVQDIFQFINDQWPTFTHYSKMNNRISISGRTISLVRPSERPTTNMKNSLQGQALAENAKELSKLARLKPLKKDGIVVIIGNAVPYADSEFLNGPAIYERAASFANLKGQMSDNIAL